MNKTAWTGYCSALDRYRNLIKTTSNAVSASVIEQLVKNREGPSYTVDTPVVFNQALNDITIDSVIKLILVGDNPGRREQAAENCRYLVGPSGKIAENFFRNSPELSIDFRKHVLIINKTPIHTPRTNELKELCTVGGERIKNAVIASQKEMALLLKEFWAALSVPVWIIGYSEMKKGGIFEVYTDTIKNLCRDNQSFENSIFLYRHFSMNQFTIDLNQKRLPGENLPDCLKRIGREYRKRVLSN